MLTDLKMSNCATRRPKHGNDFTSVFIQSDSKIVIFDYDRSGGCFDAQMNKCEPQLQPFRDLSLLSRQQSIESLCFWSKVIDLSMS